MPLEGPDGRERWARGGSKHPLPIQDSGWDPRMGWKHDTKRRGPTSERLSVESVNLVVSWFPDIREPALTRHRTWARRTNRMKTPGSYR